MTYRPSIAERITWTSGQLTASQGKVLSALLSAGDWGTGRNCHPYISTIVARSHLSRATVNRTLAELREPTQAGGPWIVPTVRRHRKPTTYDICTDRLATCPPKEQQMPISAVLPSSDVEAQNEPQEKLEAQNEPLDPGLEAQNEPPISDQDLDLEVRTHTPRAADVEAQNEPQATDALPLVGLTKPPRCQHPHKHAWCEGRVHVPKDLHFELLDRLGTRPGESPTEKAGRLVAFYADTMRHLPAEASVADAYAFWNGAYRAWVDSGARRRGEKTPKPQRHEGLAAGSLNCQHEPRCATFHACIDRTIAEARADRKQRFG